MLGGFVSIIFYGVLFLYKIIFFESIHDDSQKVPHFLSELDSF